LHFPFRVVMYCSGHGNLGPGRPAIQSNSQTLLQTPPDMEDTSSETGKLHRTPGLSLQEKLLGPVAWKALGYTALAALFSMVAALQWFSYVVPTEPSLAAAVFSTALALPVGAFAVWKLRGTFAEADRLAMARNGEIAVAQTLEKMRGRGYGAFHDVQADDFNIDHVLVGPTGIYALETTTQPRPESEDPVVRFEGSRLLVDGEEPDRDPVDKAKAEARWVRDKLRDATGIQFPVHPVVLYPGWFVEQPADGPRRDVWVLNESYLPVYLDRERRVLTEDAMRLAQSRLSCWTQV